MKYLNMSIVFLFLKLFIFLEIKVALIIYSLSKAAEDNGLIALIRSLLPVSWPEWGHMLAWRHVHPM